MAYYDGYGRGSFLSNIPPVTKNLILINIVIFIATLVNENFMIEKFALFYPASPFFKPWQLITHMFMHGGFWHIFLNMYSLFLFGSVLENAIGSKKFFVFYFVAGFGAVALHMGVQYLQCMHFLAANDTSSYYKLLGIPTLGASGAIYGLQIGFAMLYPNTVLTLVFPPISLKAKWFMLIFVAIELVTGITGTMDGVAHFAHLGGALFGCLLMLWWKKCSRLYDRDKWI